MKKLLAIAVLLSAGTATADPQQARQATDNLIKQMQQGRPSLTERLRSIEQQPTQPSVPLQPSVPSQPTGVANAGSASSGSVGAASGAPVAPSSASLVGGFTTGTIAAAAAVAAVTVAVAANSDGKADPVVEKPKTLKCEGSDPLTDGVCIRTTEVTTVTGSGTGTATTTVVVPVTSTYAPTLG